MTPSQPKFDPLANPKAVVLGPQVRFTILTPCMLRMEHSPNGQFEDRPSQVFWYRRQPVPTFTVSQTDDSLEIETDELLVKYTGKGDDFSRRNLSVHVKATGVTWRPGARDQRNLRGTFRTLDEADGAVRLEPGLMSRAGYSLIDDSNTLVFNQEGWLEPRSQPENQDLYFLGYALEYTRCIKDYCRVAGRVPMIPRWALGNWWSRYWPYSQSELQQLMLDFEQHQIPLSVCIIDMDWHIVKQDNQSFWTGYTWNRQLWPDPEGFITWLHKKGLRTALNLHPADGVQPHEEQYPAMARFMGIDPNTQESVAFDCADPQFVQGYFEILHHPLEAQGVDFWWLDWQQGQSSKQAGLDPLWWLNHLHFYDLGRDNSKRPFIFSRWGGLGNHRYPIGFSGDTTVSWESLAFQPYFTATAANVGYGWWSHDIGGHMGGLEDAELFTRWVQYGVFSPILRLHSTQNAYQDRRPWAMDAETLRLVRTAMQLRHQFVPYLYTLAWRNHTADLPPIFPMYYSYPQAEDAYQCPAQYFFGADLIAAPYVSPLNPETKLSKQAVWLPGAEQKEPGWYNFFTGEYYQGGGWETLHGSLDDMLLFARSGAIIPLAAPRSWGGIDNPEKMEIHIFTGADGTFELFEDDGATNEYLAGNYHLTRFEQVWQKNQLTLKVSGTQSGGLPHGYIPEQRVFDLYFTGVGVPDQITATLNQQSLAIQTRYHAETETLVIENVKIVPIDRLEVRLQTSIDSLQSHRDRRPEKVRRCLRAFRLDNNTKAAIDASLPQLLINPLRMKRYAGALTDAQMAVILENL